MKNRPLPLRTCVGCKKNGEKAEFIRLVRTPEGTIEWDPDGKAKGRGAYICSRQACLDAAMKKGLLARSLHCSLTMPQREQLLKEFSEFAK